MKRRRRKRAGRGQGGGEGGGDARERRVERQNARIFAESLAVCVTEDESIAPESLATIASIESAMSAKWPDGGKDF